MKIEFRRIRSGAVAPCKANDTDAGFDFYVPLDRDPLMIYPHERVLIKTGIIAAIPPGWYMQMMSRSGLALNSYIDTRAGVIDSSYRGEIGVILHNDSSYDEVEINPGDKISQGIILPVPDVEWVEVDALEDTSRGEGGFGSSGRGRNLGIDL